MTLAGGTKNPTIFTLIEKKKTGKKGGRKRELKEGH